MIRCGRIWTGKDGNSLFNEGTVDLSKGERNDTLGEKMAAASISFRETNRVALSPRMMRRHASSSSRSRARWSSRQPRSRAPFSAVSGSWAAGPSGRC